MRTLAATLLTAVVLSLWGSVAAASTPTGSAADPKLCKALARIGSLDGDFTKALTESDSWDDALDELATIAPKLNKAWRTVVRRIPDDLEDAARIVARFTKRAQGKLAETESLEEAGDVLIDDPDATAAGLASLELDTFSRDTCDVSINNE